MNLNAIAFDAFNRANGALGSNWTTDTTPNVGFTIQSNAAGPPSDTDSGSTRTAETFANDQYAKAKYVSTLANANTDEGIGVSLRSDAAGKRYRILGGGTGGAARAIIAIDNGGYTNLANVPCEFSAGDVIEGRAVGRLISLYKNGVIQTSVVNSGLASGKPGLYFSSSQTLNTLDDWEGGEITVTIQTLDDFLWPQLVPNRGTISTSLSVTAAAQVTLTTNNGQVCILCYAPFAGSLTDFTVRTQTVSVTSGPLNFDFRVESVTNGRPSGSLLGTNSNATVSVATTDDNVWKTATLTTPVTVTQGQLIALVIKCPAAGTFSFTLGGFANLQATTGNFPCVLTDSAGDGTYETLASGAAPSVAVKIGGSYRRVAPLLPIDLATAPAFGSATSPDEYALRLLSPVKLRIKGACVVLGNVAAGGDFTVSLWPDSAGSQTDANALVQVACDGDLMGNTTNDGCFNVVFPTSIELDANTPYWLGVRADTANTIIVYQATTLSATLMTAWPGGIETYGGSRTWTAGSANAFTHFTNDNGSPFFAGLFDGIEAGGVRYRPNLRGGMQ